MQTDLRKSLDVALKVEQLFTVELKAINATLEAELALEDSLVVYLAEIYNQTIANIEGLKIQVINITEQMRLFGEEGLEKELGVHKENENEAA